MQRLAQEPSSGGIAVLIEPACGFSQSRPLIAKAIRASQVVTGSPYWGIVDLPRVLALAVRRRHPELARVPLVLAALEGDELWVNDSHPSLALSHVHGRAQSIVVEPDGAAVRATYHGETRAELVFTIRSSLCTRKGFNPRVLKKDAQQQMRKMIALKLMNMEASETDDGEQRVSTFPCVVGLLIVFVAAQMLTKEHTLARHVWSSCSVFATMTQDGAVARTLLQHVVVLEGIPRVPFDVALFNQHCAQLSGAAEPVAGVTLAESDIMQLAFAGACELARSIEWCPTPL